MRVDTAIRRRWMLWLLPLSAFVLVLGLAAWFGYFFLGIGKPPSLESHLDEIEGVEEASFWVHTQPFVETTDPGEWTLHMRGAWDAEKVESVTREAIRIISAADDPLDDGVPALEVMQGRGRVALGVFPDASEEVSGLVEVADGVARSTMQAFTVDILMWSQPTVTVEPETPEAVARAAQDLVWLAEPSAVASVNVGVSLEEECFRGEFSSTMNEYRLSAAPEVAQLVDLTAPEAVSVRMAEDEWGLYVGMWAQYADSAAAAAAHQAASSPGISVRARRCEPGGV